MCRGLYRRCRLFLDGHPVEGRGIMALPSLREMTWAARLGAMGVKCIPITYKSCELQGDRLQQNILADWAKALEWKFHKWVLVALFCTPPVAQSMIFVRINTGWRNKTGPSSHCKYSEIP